jgi:hypothetical protein
VRENVSVMAEPARELLIRGSQVRLRPGAPLKQRLLPAIVSAGAGHRLPLVPRRRKTRSESLRSPAALAGVDSVTSPLTELLHTMLRGKQPLVFGRWIHVCSEAAVVLQRGRIQTDVAGHAP